MAAAAASSIASSAASFTALADFSAAYFGNTSRAGLLRQYNFLAADVVKGGDKLTIPIVHVQVRAAKLPPPDSESKARKQKRDEVSAQAIAGLRTARAAWRSGEFATVKRVLTGIDTDYLDTFMAIEVNLLLGGAYVAFDDQDSAIATFRLARSRRPSATLDPYWYSPCMIELWNQATPAEPSP